MTARWPAASNCRRPAGCAATRCACMARSTRRGSPRSPGASRSTASPMARSAPSSNVTQGSNAWITLTLREGKNREVRRVLEHLGLQVTRLIRLVLRAVPARQSGARRSRRNLRRRRWPSSSAMRRRAGRRMRTAGASAQKVHHVMAGLDLWVSAHGSVGISPPAQSVVVSPAHVDAGSRPDTTRKGGKCTL